MVNRNLIRSLENDPELDSFYEDAMRGADETALGTIDEGPGFDVNRIVVGKILRIGEKAKAFKGDEADFQRLSKKG